MKTGIYKLEKRAEFTSQKIGNRQFFKLAIGIIVENQRNAIYQATVIRFG
jgi:hypothetical protein